MSAAPATQVDTTKVTNRRAVHFASLDELLADAERLVQLDAQGKVRPLGNMSLGQALGHLALWMKASIDGIPDDLRPPAAVKLLGRMLPVQQETDPATGFPVSNKVKIADGLQIGY